MTSINNVPESASQTASIPHDPWISEEELYTEGSSDDEDDMALRMKRRAQEEKKEKQSSAAHHVRRTERRVVSTSKATGNSSANDCDLIEGDNQGVNDFKWRPTQGSTKLKQTSDHSDSSKNGDEAQNSSQTPSSQSLSEAYSNMHKLDALLRDSDRRLKDAQAETLRAQLSTRAQLRDLREQVGAQNVALSANWDAFMNLCPVIEPSWACGKECLPASGPGSKAEWSLLEFPGAAAAPGVAGRGAHRAGPRGDGADSVLPRISGVESEADDSEDSESSGSALAITDEEKMKLAALLRDVDQDHEGGPGLGGYHLDAEVRRSLDHIDEKLQELVLDASDAGSVSAAPPSRGASKGPRGATRQQRLEDIDRCLQSLAESALEDTEPLGEEAVRSLLQDAQGALGRGEGAASGAAAAAATGAESGLISALLDEARRELPRFHYRYCETADQELPRLNSAAR
ncbi:uncharacterized protein LOC113217804 isoform X2 [Frankliniella occidentalis]|uniref:Uncharacterized protein LOC113217804 isoform X2 n=1 Tax=Frankliniella occidentalis TaxID=133901 RepID=A0A6J1TPY9_FRAOC|nr:uncharacterized protein LOC113217804 isoform X2 [Frankliniella occidentalis]